MILYLLAAWALKSTAVAVLALLAMWAARRRAAADRAAILQLAIGALLLLPLLGRALPHVEIGVSTGAMALPLGPDPAATAALPHAAASTMTAVPGFLPDRALLATFLYFAGVALFVSRLLLGVWTLRRWTAEASEISHPRWRRMLTERAAAMHVRPPRLLLSMHAPGPLSWGLARPVILIDKSSAARLEDALAILSHELAHVARRDWAALIFTRLVAILFWFNPLVWLLARQLEDETEKAADHKAAGELGSAQYAETLVRYARRDRHWRIPALTIAAGRRRLSGRILALLSDEERPPIGLPGRAGAALVGAVLISALAAVGFVANASIGDGVVAAERLFPELDHYYAVPAAERSKVALSYALTVDGKPPAGLRLVLEVGGRRTLLPLAGNGRIERVPSATDFAAHARIVVQGPPGRHNVEIEPNLQTSIAPAREISAADCALAVAQVKAASRKIMGLRGFFLSRVKAVTFPGAGSGVALLAGGRIVSLPRLNGVPAYDPAVIRSARSIRLARAPTFIDLQ